MRTEAMVPPAAAAGAGRVCPVRVCAAALNIHPAADTSMAASTASQQIVNRFGTKTPTPEACDVPRHRPPASGDKTLYEFHDPEMDEIIPGSKPHQGQNQCQADAEAIFLSPLAQRFPANRLSGIEQQVPPVKHRHREQVYQAKIDRQHAHNT